MPQKTLTIKSPDGKKTKTITYDGPDPTPDDVEEIANKPEGWSDNFDFMKASGEMLGKQKRDELYKKLSTPEKKPGFLSNLADIAETPFTMGKGLLDQMVPGGSKNTYESTETILSPFKRAIESWRNPNIGKVEATGMSLAAIPEALGIPMQSAGLDIGSGHWGRGLAEAGMSLLGGYGMGRGLRGEAPSIQGEVIPPPRQLGAGPARITNPNRLLEAPAIDADIIRSVVTPNADLTRPALLAQNPNPLITPEAGVADLTRKALMPPAQGLFEGRTGEPVPRFTGTSPTADVNQIPLYDQLGLIAPEVTRNPTEIQLRGEQSKISGPLREDVSIPQEIGFHSERPNYAAAAGQIEEVPGSPRIEMRANPSRITKPIIEPLVENAAKSDIPELKVAGETIAQKPEEIGNLRQALRNNFIASSIGQLEGLSPKLANVIQKVRSDSEVLSGKLISPIRAAIDKLSDAEWKNTQETLDGKATPANTRVKNIVDAVQAIIDKKRGILVQRAKAAGLVTKEPSGKRLFEGLENYWPHKATEDWLAKQPNVLDSIMKENKVSRGEAMNLLDRANRYGEKVKGFQHERVGEEGIAKSDYEYRTDPEALFEHIDEMSRRVVEAEQLGTKDINDSASPVSMLIETSKNPNQATTLVRRLLGRDPSAQKADSIFVRNISGLVSALRLHSIFISNFAPQAVTFARTNMGMFTKGVWDAVWHGKKYGEFGDSAGVLQGFMKGFQRDIGTNKIVNKVYGLEKSEHMQRSFAARVGANMAEYYFDQVKQNPANRIMAKRLEELVLEPADQVIKQKALTEDQILRAGNRGANVTQGRADPMDVPYGWSGPLPAWAQLLLMYKRFAFNGAKILKDTLKRDPSLPMTPKNFDIVRFAKLTGASIVMGEALGDVKQGIKGGVAGAVSGKGILNGMVDEIEKRGQYYSVDHPYVGRVIDNYLNAWAGGILADMIGATITGPSKATATIAGPAYGLAADIGSGLWQGVSTTAQGAPDWSNLAKVGASFFGPPGRGVAQGIKER